MMCMTLILAIEQGHVVLEASFITKFEKYVTKVTMLLYARDWTGSYAASKGWRWVYPIWQYLQKGRGFSELMGYVFSGFLNQLWLERKERSEGNDFKGVECSARRAHSTLGFSEKGILLVIYLGQHLLHVANVRHPKELWYKNFRRIPEEKKNHVPCIMLVCHLYAMRLQGLV
ncbi:hypothetical protein L2E82_27080 [Cichorium intybus]|uniref:Uncharacterized protein n=1 Tax=Cichorium intybus TaxID=13427 RepID=A0ACB9CS31_CICIN|nr:hypothetical protein L2E82_27080 [Cichorium intybus]